MLKSVVKARAARAMGHPIEVVHNQRLTPSVARLVFEGAGLEGVNWTPGDKVKLGAEGAFLKSYTPMSVERQTGRMEIIFHLHGQGPASRWAASAAPGDRAVYLGPARSMPFTTDVSWARFHGDETTLGLARALIDALEPGVEVAGGIELARPDLAAVQALELPLAAVERRGAHGVAALEHASTVPIGDGRGVIWLSGHADSVRALRDHYRARGVDPSDICVKPYWSDRGHAHRKQLERSLLRA